MQISSTTAALPVQVDGAVAFGFTDINKQLRGQILQHGVFQHLRKTNYRWSETPPPRNPKQGGAITAHTDFMMMS